MSRFTGTVPVAHRFQAGMLEDVTTTGARVPMRDQEPLGHGSLIQPRERPQPGPDSAEVLWIYEPMAVDVDEQVFSLQCAHEPIAQVTQYCCPSTRPAGCPGQIQYVGPQPPALSKYGTDAVK